ncbi:hypothetical protein DES32_3023 [Methylovirgula ligni]|uniref:Uncharacterized protein n=1 Tax=Methylovirgula ligni TaxID=569860 RepID=A0A3D9YNL4_9HYPH|nr:hypothetical protein DES32_3023 [Methylovirgula ligni]
MCSDRPSRLRRPVPKVRQKKTEGSSVSGQHSPETVAGVADYIANMSAELATLAGGADLETLSYLLNLARLEAESHVPKLNEPSN